MRTFGFWEANDSHGIGIKMMISTMTSLSFKGSIFLSYSSPLPLPSPLSLQIVSIDW